MLQKPSPKSKARDHVKYLTSRLALWKNGELKKLIDATKRSIAGTSLNHLVALHIRLSPRADKSVPFPHADGLLWEVCAMGSLRGRTVIEHREKYYYEDRLGTFWYVVDQPPSASVR